MTKGDRKKGNREIKKPKQPKASPPPAGKLVEQPQLNIGRKKP